MVGSIIIEHTAITRVARLKNQLPEPSVPTRKW